jgi:hypothetical protein
MKTEIMTKIQTLVDNHRTIIKGLTEKIKAWEMDTVYADDYKKEKIKEFQKEAEQNDTLFNAQVKEVISKEKAAIIGEPASKPADYQVRISNALKLLELAGNKLTDDQAYGILKPFQGDYETMTLFQAAIGGLTQSGGVWGTFNKTFGKTNEVMALLNSFKLVEQTSQNLFNSKEVGLEGAIKTDIFMKSINNIDSLVFGK